MNSTKFRMSWLAYMLGIALVVVLATSCNNDNDFRGETYWVSMATVEAPDQTGSFNIGYAPFSLFTDADESLFPAYLSSYIVGYITKDQQRVLIEYNLLSGERNGYDHYIRLVDMVNVLTKPTATLTADTEANSVLRGVAPIRINNVWISDNYVNIVFSYKGSFGSTHYINLVDNKENPGPNPDAGVYTLEFVHDDKGDTGGFWFKGIVSFKLPENIGDVTKIKIDCDNFGTPQSVTRDYGASDVAPKIDDLSDVKIE